MTCVHKTIHASLDRWMECHWHIHQIERNYHDPEPFRFSLNSFMRAAKEVPQILKMELQNHVHFQATLKPIIDSLNADPLLKLLHKKRDFLVHQGMLEPLSTGLAGVTRGRGKVKMVVRFNVGPNESSDDAFVRYVETCKRSPDFWALCGPDGDTWPCIQRKWKISEFPDDELLELAITAWRTLGDSISCVLVELGAEALDFSMSCRHNPERVRMREYSVAQFEELMQQ